MPTGNTVTWSLWHLAFAAAVFCGIAVPQQAPAAEATSAPTCTLCVAAGHPWRPPFGLERVGRSLTATITIADAAQPPAAYELVGYAQGKEVLRSALPLTGKPPYTCRVPLSPCPTELVVFAKRGQDAPQEMARQKVACAALEADAVARPDRLINPVDLGAILPPADWLLLAHDQQGKLDVAAVSHDRDLPGARVLAWFASAPAAKTATEMAMQQGCRAQRQLPLPPPSGVLPSDLLHVAIVTADGRELWHKTIRTMLVQKPPHWPTFGAVETKLRYDAPISLRKPDGTFASLDYATAWDSKLHDVVVTLPNGQRYVFWRGSSYIPFWASRHNVGFNYEWAENMPPPDAVDCVEPLMDKELRYGRVRIVETTPARVHVRWSYQSCDLNYKVWGDSAVEDYYFYPDGFGTRVMTLQSDPKCNYELSEFIVLTPQSTYPWSVLPTNIMDILFLDGQKRALTCPFTNETHAALAGTPAVPAIYRVRMHKDEPLAAVYFTPRDVSLPPTFYPPFVNRGEVVTPVYWGSHWPLARGKSTGWAIDDRVAFTPCHNSVVSWCKCRPAPLHTAQFETLDSCGRPRTMLAQTWAWLIGMSDADDERLLAWARSFAAPPALELQGARLAPLPYAPERRALCVVVEDANPTITLVPTGVCVNPVFELAEAPQALRSVRLADRLLPADQYAWDGKTLWLNATLTQRTPLRLEFASATASAGNSAEQ